MDTPLWQRSKTDDDLPEVQKENKQETEETKEEGSMVTQTRPTLEGEISKTGWEVKELLQDDKQVCFRVMVKNEDRDWYKLDVRCLKEKFTKIGL